MKLSDLDKLNKLRDQYANVNEELRKLTYGVSQVTLQSTVGYVIIIDPRICSSVTTVAVDSLTRRRNELVSLLMLHGVDEFDT